MHKRATTVGEKGLPPQIGVRESSAAGAVQSRDPADGSARTGIALGAGEPSLKSGERSDDPGCLECPAASTDRDLTETPVATIPAHHATGVPAPKRGRHGRQRAGRPPNGNVF